MAVPGGVVSVAGGTLHVASSLMEIETRLGPLAFDARHDSVAGGWRFGFELELQDGLFVDATGASWDVTALADGAIVPGTDWVKLDAGRMKTRGGLVHEFDAAGRLAAIHWSSDPYPRIHHVTGLVGAEVRVVAIEQCTAPIACEPIYELAWDGSGRLLAVTDRAGRRAELAWDAAGRLVAARDAGDVESGLPGARYTWESDALVGLETSDGERVAFHHVGGRIASVVAEGPGSPTHTFGYGRLANGLGRTVVTGPGGERTEFVWDAERRLRRRTLLDLDESTHFDWSGLRVTRRETPDGVAVESAWQAGWLVSESLPGGNVRGYAWNLDGTNRLDPFAGAITEASDVFGVVLAVSYDADGRPVAIRDGAGDTTTLLWSGVELTAVTLPAGLTQTFEAYGEHGRPTVMRVGGEIVDQAVYDAVGNQLSGRDLSDPLSTSMPGVVERVFDADRNVAALVLLEEDPVGSPVERTLRIHRRADGRPLRIERPYAGDTEHFYDALGRRMETRERVDGTWRATTFAWDTSGRLVAVEMPNGMGRTFRHDAAGRVETATALRDGIVESTLRSTWQAGRLVATHDSVGDADEFYVHDAAGRLVRVIHTRGETTEIVWDARGRVSRLTLRMPDGSTLRTLAMAYDGADREVALHDGGAEGPELLGREYVDGRLVATRYGNGLERRYGFDETTGRWTHAVTTAADGSWVADMYLGLNASVTAVFGYLLTRTADPQGLVPDPPATSEPGQVQTDEAFLLDAGRLTRPAGLRLRSMNLRGDILALGSSSYDALGNRLRSSQELHGTWETRGFVYNQEHNRLLARQRREWIDGKLVIESDRTYEWDESGYATAVNGVPIVWNALGRIQNLGGLASFVWDAAGRPVSRTVLGETTEYWFGGRLEAPAGEAPGHLDLGELRLDLVGGDHRYRHLDPRRNVKFVTDAAGNVVAHHLYADYGRFATYGPDDDARGFAGGTHAAGFVVLGARVLDPEVGRFLSPDPVEQVLDPFSYAWGNPFQLWDPSGLHPHEMPNGPPAEATVMQILGFVFMGLGAVLVPGPAVTAVLIGRGAILLGTALQGVAIGIRDRHGRGSGGSSSDGAIPSIPPPPAAGIAFKEVCVDGDCILAPRSYGSGGADAPRGGGGGGGLGFDPGAASCSSPTGCVSAPGFLIVLPWLFRRGARTRT